ncbi:MAG: tetratricopeptide repeat protein [Bacteroidota bacterium]
MKHIFSVLLLLLLIKTPSLSQNKKLDSLFYVIKTTQSDTIKFKAYLTIADYIMQTNTDSAIYYLNLAEEISKKISNFNEELYKGEVIRQKAWIYYLKGDYLKSMELLSNVEQLTNKYIIYPNSSIKKHALKLKSDVLANIGIVYQNQSQYNKALEYYFSALKICEELNNKESQVSILTNIGIVYSNFSKYPKALKAFFKALKINEEVGNKKITASILANIGNIYSDQSQNDMALEYYLKALNILEELDKKNEKAAILGNIGNIYQEENEYNKALEYYNKALKLKKETDDKLGQSIILGNIGELYMEQKRYGLAEKYLKQAELINREMKSIYYLSFTCQQLSELYAKLGKYKDAYFYQKEYLENYDSVNSISNRKALQTIELKYYYEKKQSLMKAEHEKQIAIQKKEKEKQKLISWSVGGGFVLTSVFFVLVFNRLQVTRKQKKIIEEQKKLVEEQKQLVEDKNREILDSITYAKRIQQAILPTRDRWQTLLPKSFVLYLPKDIIAGDFYWLEETNDFVYFAAADSTGHGVPGALVSVVCSGALTKAVREEKIVDTGKILDRARQIVVERFSSNEQQLRDGMDICLVRMNKHNHLKIQFSGANRPLIIINSEKEVVEIKGDKQPVGWYEDSIAFSQHEITLTNGSRVYLSTDGYADQFGGDRCKKLGSKKFIEFLKNIHEYPILEQEKHVLDFFNHWKGEQFQVDDVTLIGVEV